MSTITDNELEWLARRARLESVWHRYPDEIRAAVAGAEQTVAALNLPQGSKAEPWPPVPADHDE